ncbi:MAG: TolC family protein [Clostridiales bacterium]|nr:TolC family protein [Clostridiales bacterium]
MRRGKRLCSGGLALLLAAAAPLTAMAATPEFARTGEEWARLRDDVIEYDELEDLIAEYNVTVQTNQLDMAKFKREYGDTRDDISDKYRELADEIYSSVSYPSTDDATYGYTIASVLTAEVQAKNFEEAADDNLEDIEIIYLDYKNAEKTLVTVAQANMISYESGLLQIQQAELAKKQAELAYSSAQTSMATGMTTMVDVLSAQETMLTAQRTITSSQSSIENIRQKLQVMLGWTYDASPEIGAVPSADVSRIAEMNPEADKEAALANNYTLQVNKRKLENAVSPETVETLQRTIADNERQIASSLETSYQSVLTAKLSYDQAAANLELEQRNLRQIAAQYAQGTASSMEYQNQQYTTQSAELDLQIADLSLLQAMETYDWAVNGLASAS